MKILHIAEPQTFTKPFFSLIEKNFDAEDHAILSRGKSNGWPNELKVTNKTRSGLIWVYNFLKSAQKAEKIILHGLFDKRILLILSMQPWLLKKCYWCIWGGDLYCYKNRRRDFISNQFEIIRFFVISRIGHFVTYIKGDYELARIWYGAKGKYHECLGFESNLYKETIVPPKEGQVINILVGNSADPSNNHLEIFENLLPFKGGDFLIYCPLSYGSAVYSDRIAKLGKEIFGNKFIPLLEFTPFEKYLEFLGQIDIAIFAHRRQQALGNTITLLGLGKKVFIRSDVTTWDFFEQNNIKVFDVCGIELSVLDEKTKSKNMAEVRKYFSYENLIRQWIEIFE